jgi:hypothetical protein
MGKMDQLKQVLYAFKSIFTHRGNNLFAYLHLLPTTNIAGYF